MTFELFFVVFKLWFSRVCERNLPLNTFFCGVTALVIRCMDTPSHGKRVTFLRKTDVDDSFLFIISFDLANSFHPDRATPNYDQEIPSHPITFTDKS